MIDRYNEIEIINKGIFMYLHIAVEIVVSTINKNSFSSASYDFKHNQRTF